MNIEKQLETAVRTNHLVLVVFFMRTGRLITNG